MNKLFFLGFLMLLFISCSEDDSIVRDEINFDFPSTYTFEREGTTSIDFEGQTTRLTMGGILNDELLEYPNKNADAESVKEDLLGLFRNEGTYASTLFSDLDASKNLSGKTAASVANTPNLGVILDLEGYIKSQVDEVFPQWNVTASQGSAGNILDGSTLRYINSKGLEYDQAFGKALIGALVLDQIVNVYLTPAILDKGTNRTDNDNGTLVSGKNYTDMEHKWDEAFGYVYGLEANIESPALNVDDFLNKYINSVRLDPDFSDIDEKIYKAFIVGRAAIVAKDYSQRDKQAKILQRELSKIIAIRAIHYLKRGEAEFGSLGTAFHQLSEGYGFIYSLQFTRNPDTGSPYFSRAEVEVILNNIYGNLTNGFYDLRFDTTDILDKEAQKIASRFGLTVAKAINF